MDDFLVLGKDAKELEQQTIALMEKARQHNIFFKLSKCSWHKKEINMLGFKVENGKLQIEEKKTVDVKNWPIPIKKKQVQCFLGFCNFYRRFIKNYTKIAGPLHELTGGKKGSRTSFTWGKEQSEAFHQMKEAITSAPVLILPDLDKPFRIEVDASKRAIGSVLTQQDKEGR